MPLLALVCRADDARDGTSVPAAARAFLAPLGELDALPDLPAATPAVPQDVAVARALGALPAEAAALAPADARQVAAIVAAVLGVPGERSSELRPAAGSVTLLRAAEDELTLMQYGVLPADPLLHGDAHAARLYLVRHGETATVTRDGLMFSHAPLPLTRRGGEQAVALRASLEAVPAATVHASDIARAAETARALAGERDVRLHAGLREVPLGDLEGAHYTEVFSAATGFLSHPDAALPGGESFRAVGARAAAALDGILATADGADVVVVAHGGVNRALLGRLLDLPAERALKIRQDWAAVNVLERDDGRWRAAMINWSPAGLEELEHAQRAALVGATPTTLGGHVMDWKRR